MDACHSSDIDMDLLVCFSKEAIEVCAALGLILAMR